jgi:hypothetical protein
VRRVEESRKIDIDRELNEVACRSFRDVADHDYITARMCCRVELMGQFHWAALQALEKYLKGILFFNRVDARDVRHDLSKALDRARQLDFEIKMSDSTRKLVEHLDQYGRFRYLEVSSFMLGPMLWRLDLAVWEIRRYCRVVRQSDVASIEASDPGRPKSMYLAGGELERILSKKDHAARGPLIWQNKFFVMRHRSKVYVPTGFYAVNAPLTLRPEIVDEVAKWVYLPREVVRAYHEYAEERRVRSSSVSSTVPSESSSAAQPPLEPSS